MSQEKNKKIILDLGNSSNAQSFQGENMLHSSEFVRIETEVKQRLTQLEKIDDEKFKHSVQHSHEAFTISGLRGSGKTSFLYSLRSTFEDNPSLQVLEILDPTLIEEKGHIFLTIISLIDEAVQEKMNRRASYKGCCVEQCKNEWKHLLRKLAAGLPTIDTNLNSSTLQLG